MDRLELARREHENLIAAYAVIADGVPGAVVRREGGVAAILTGLPVRMFNQIVVDGDRAGEAALLAAIETARERGDRFLVHLRAGIDRRLFSAMGRLGLVPLESGPPMPGMALHPIPDRPLAAEPGHEIRRVFDLAGLEDHIAVVVAGFEMPDSFARMILPSSLVGMPGVSVYVGYTDGMPVTAGAGIRSGNTIGIYNIATLDAFRRRGYGAAMTTRIAADGAMAGCDVAILQASEMGKPVYERLGYETVVEYRAYVDPAPETGA